MGCVCCNEGVGRVLEGRRGSSEASQQADLRSSAEFIEVTATSSYCVRFHFCTSD